MDNKIVLNNKSIVNKVKDVFISYRRDKGKNYASAFNALLKSKGYDTFFDLQEVYSGDYMTKLEEGIKNSLMVLFIITEGSLARMEKPEDISRIELEIADREGVPILPISTIGEQAITDMNQYKHIEIVSKLMNYNTRFYSHEMQQDANNFILSVCEENRGKRFHNLSTNVSQSLVEMVYEIRNVEDEVLDGSLFLNPSDRYSYRYAGRLKGYSPWGYGRLTNIDTGEVFEMDFSIEGELSGEGKIYRNSTLMYKGMIKRLIPEHYGELHKEGYIYRGMFSQGKPNARGEYIMEDGTYCKGLFTNSRGNGYLKLPNGDQYKGELEDLQMCGKGILIRNNGDKYTGEFQRGEFQGRIFRGIIEHGTEVIKGQVNRDYELNGDVEVYCKETSRLKFRGTYINGVKEGRSEFIETGESLNKTFRELMGIPSIGYEYKLDHNARYNLKCYIKNGKTDLEKGIEITDMYREPVFSYNELSGKEFHKEGYKERNNIISIERVGKPNIILGKREGLVSVPCTYLGEYGEKSGEIFLDLSKVEYPLEGEDIRGRIRMVMELNPDLPSNIADILNPLISRGGSISIERE